MNFRSEEWHISTLKINISPSFTGDVHGQCRLTALPLHIAPISTVLSLVFYYQDFSR